MEYTDIAAKKESTNSPLLGFLTIMGIFILFLAIFQEANNTYAHVDNNQMVVVEGSKNR